ncbi:hypothetical protein [Demequina activiva]|uniref:Uncharacterized protein n=1 Tax=Demequina activiva TaxID=1582364 RepID=A0A919Q109_9MICO|nr:hypothetical protein [Demequina activiva]GIG54049.1 hypothetical protein Dac01nite_08010 [Demequina activiva]
MTDDLRDLLARAGRDEASAARREDFHGAFGDAVRGRVRRRRAVRAAGVGSVAAVSVGAIAFGAVRLPGMTDAGPLSSGDCPPGTVASSASAGATGAPALEWSVAPPVSVEFDGKTYTVSSTSGASAELFVEDGRLSVSDLGGESELREQDGTYTIELSDGMLVRAELDTDSGELIAWADGEDAPSAVIEVDAAAPDVVCVTPEPSPPSEAAVNACVDGRWHIDAEVLRPDLVYGVTNTEDPDSQASSTPGVAIQPMLLDQRVITVVLDAGTGEPLAMLEAAEPEQELLVRLSEGDALRVAKNGDGTFAFQLLDGRWMTVTDDDGPWNGQDVVALSGQMPRAVSASAAPDDGLAWTDLARELADDFDLEWPESPWVCDAAGSVDDGTDGATTSPSPAPSPSPGIDPAAASSPYQCGYVFETAERRTSEWAVTNAQWRDGDAVWTMLEDWYGGSLRSFLVEPSGPAATFDADGTFFDARGAMPGNGGLGSDSGDGIFHDVWQYDGMGSQSLTFVAALDGRVIAVADPTPQPSGMLVDKNEADAPTSAVLLDASALVPCPSVSPDQVAEADIVAVTAAAARDDEGAIEVQYAWETMGRP